VSSALPGEAPSLCGHSLLLPTREMAMRQRGRAGTGSSTPAVVKALLVSVVLAVGIWTFLATAPVWRSSAGRQGIRQHIKPAPPPVAPQLASAQPRLPEASCHGPEGEGTPKVELDGSVVTPGWSSDGRGLRTGSPRECCEACLAQRGCNVWVFCLLGGTAPCAGQCWLKRQDNPVAPAARASGPSVPWVSGTLRRAFWPPSAPLPLPDTVLATVTLASPAGDIRLALRPEWSRESATYVRQLADLGDELCVDCKFYRAEPGFLLQGVLRAVIPANNITTPGPRPMQSGDVGWAGGGPGPDFFIYLSDRPATDWGTSHTVWAEVADAESLATARRLVGLPSHTPGGPGTMRFLRDTLPLSVHRR